jgi:diguanylate cyclase (GGDEF)-like protein
MWQHIVNLWSAIFSPMKHRIYPGRKMRLVLIGLLVVGFSVCASLLSTHLAFQMTGTVDYASSMLVAAIIPLLVAPTAYIWIAQLTWKLEQSNVELDRMAHSDVLTNIANRRYAMQWLRAAMEGEGKDAKTPDIMIAMADIDHFKRINDSYGHDAGDDCIVHVARTIETLVPHGWLVARMGGEEFLIAAKGADEADFGAAIEHIRRTLEHVPLITPQGRYGMTASFGYAKMMAGDTLDHSLRRADTALYAAKDGGRNRTVAATG